VQFDVYYREGLRDGPAAGISQTVEDPATEGARTAAALRSLADADLGRVFRPLRPGQHQSEEWTVRRAARRMIAHERAHAAEILQRRTWVLLGTPALSRGA
jgi:hypothetical protein